MLEFLHKKFPVTPSIREQGRTEGSIHHPCYLHLLGKEGQHSITLRTHQVATAI
jgi:hypothetical protein